MDVISYQEAKEKGLPYYFTGKPCKYGHINKRYVSCKKCLSCTEIYVEKNNEKLKQQKNARYQNKRKEILQSAKIYRQLNRDKILNYFQQNKEILAERKKEYRKQNREKDLQHTSKRRASKKQAVPIWFDSKKFEALHKEARRLSEETGIPHQVDHIVPLTSLFVCGLHWHGNAQILTAFENISKHNKYWPDMSDTSDLELLQLVETYIQSRA